MQRKFSVLTPTFNAMPWIEDCARSIADQQDVEVEHIVQDGRSNDGTAEFITRLPGGLGISEKDDGMYDAINRAWRRATGDYVLHLNGDEQVLPHALHDVANHFDAHPEIDILIGGVLICNADGSLRCYRKGVKPPISIMLTSHHPVQSCGIFLRRASFADRPWLYDPGFRIISDVLFMIDAVRLGKRIAVLDRFTSIFFMTGKNMGLTQSATAQLEYAHQMSLAPGWMKPLAPIFRAAFQLRKALGGAYTTRKLTYQLYLQGFDQRQTFLAHHAHGIYKPEQTSESPA